LSMRNDIQIERWPLDRVTPSGANPRTHSAEQVAQIAASIREFGFVNPILVGTDGTIIAGEGRFRAARIQGLRDVPVIVLEHLSDVQRRALAIADNQLALNAGWDEQMLREQLAALKDEEFDLNLLGFDDLELSRQLAAQETASGLVDEDEIPDVPAVAVTKPGDLWLLGTRKGQSQHKVLCGDSTVSETVQRLLADRPVPLLMVTDPPYGVSLDPEWREEVGLNPRTRQGGKVANDDRVDWSEAWALFPGDVAYVWHAGIPLHRNLLADPSRWRAVVGRIDFHAAVQIDLALAILVVAEGLQRERQQGRLFFGEHGRHLPLSGAVNARVGPALFPMIQVSLSILQTFEALSLEGCFLGMAHAALDLTFTIRIAHPTGQRHRAVMRQHIAV